MSYKNKPGLLKFLDLLSVLSILGAAGLVFLYAPLELVMGWVQKVFYFHVGAGWVGMLSYLIAAICGAVFLRTGKQRWDIASRSCVELGLVFTMINVVTGSIWARPIWNTWWTWDPRLTTAAIMELTYIAYLILRGSIDSPEKQARFGAVYSIIGFVSVPLTFFSIRTFRTIHPVVIAGSEAGAFSMEGRMGQTFLFTLLAFTVLFIDLLWHRMRLSRLEEHLKERKAYLSANSNFVVK